jgi:DNA-binding response OmpR family regulator
MPDDVVAIVNTSPDIVDMLRISLERAGIVVVSAFTHSIRDGEVDLEQFFRQHDPRVVLYDIAPPYDANWQFFQHLSQRPFMKNRVYVLTSTNERHVANLVGRDRRVYEIVGRPFDLDEIVQATREALRSRPSA